MARFSFRAEYAKSGRALCRGCRRNIENKSLRVGFEPVSETADDEGEKSFHTSVQWFHATCKCAGQFRKNPNWWSEHCPEGEDFEGYNKLTKEDRSLLKALATGLREGKGQPDKKVQPEKKTEKKEPSEKKETSGKKEVKKSKSSESESEDEEEEGSSRTGSDDEEESPKGHKRARSDESDEQKNSDDDSSSVSGESSSGSLSESEEDNKKKKKTASKKAAPAPPSKSTKKTTASPPAKKAKNAVVEYSSEALEEDQVDAINKVIQDLSTKSVVQLKAMLQKNAQKTSGSKAELLERIGEATVLGALPRCGTCGAMLRWDRNSGMYTCPGKFEDGGLPFQHSIFILGVMKRCSFKSENVDRIAWQ